MKVELENSITRLSFLCRLPDIKIAWINPCKYIHLFPAGNSMFKINNRNTRTRCEICSKLTIKIPEQHQLRRSSLLIVNFEHISRLVLVFLLLTLSK